ncbi:MAG: hypothetical protein A2289_10830 [Deltaproteobacteria bacterium RIFOXYA12_FULL_58_15]|nr:MAG: hypothetical protein A2289_10830 [Deltaproteobacteria bacterium RIFOXYA12_FULL_58_15]
MSWTSKVATAVPMGALSAVHVQDLMTEQRASWPALASGVGALSGMQQRELQDDDSRVVVQANPGRRASVHARVDPASLLARPCFLCPDNMPAAERGIGVGDLVALPNPFPIVKSHLTIPSREHEPQSLAGRELHLLELARGLGPDLFVFYNGPQCGASAPDHFHFQGGAAANIPLLAETSARGPAVEHLCQFGRQGILLRGAETAAVSERIVRLLDVLKGSTDAEPLVNVVAVYREGVNNAFVFPRMAHRPRCYFAKESARVCVSPAALEMMGIVVLADVEHIDRIDADLVRSIYAEVCLDEERIRAAIREIE